MVIRSKLTTCDLAQLGWGWSILYLMDLILRRVTGGCGRLACYHLVAQPVLLERLSRSSGQNPVRRIGATDPLIEQFPRPPHVITQRFNDKAICLAATSGERFAGFLWIAHGSYNEDEVRCRYELAQPDLSVWDFDVYVEPAFRISRTFARLWDAANTYMLEKGVCWSFSRISTFNSGSLSAHSRLGLRRLFSVCFLCLGKMQIALLSVPPFLHISSSEHSRLILRLSLPSGT